MVVKPYQYKPGSKDIGAAWSTVEEDLNNIKEHNFVVTQKSVRERFKLVMEKSSRKMSQEIASSGTNIEETELDQLCEEIKGEMDVYTEKYEDIDRKKQKEIENGQKNAQEVRTKAMESLSETRKRKEQEGVDKEVKKRNTGSETMVYLKERTEKEMALKKEQLELQKLVLEQQRQRDQRDQEQMRLLMEQNRLQNQTLLTLLQNYMNK